MSQVQWVVGFLVLSSGLAACGGVGDKAEGNEPFADRGPDQDVTETPLDEAAPAPYGGSQAGGYRPVELPAGLESLAADYRGTLRVEIPGGLTTTLMVRARIRPASFAPGGWDLFFLDETRSLSAAGVLGLQSGAADFLAARGDSHEIRAELVSLGKDVLGSPGAALKVHNLTGALRGQAFLRVPSPGADLAPFELHFSLQREELAAVDCTDTSCAAGSVCDDVTGLCAGGRFAPGYFASDRELFAMHTRVADWSMGPAIADEVPLPAVWCAGPELGLRGAWTFPAMRTDARPVMEVSGDLLCADPAMREFSPAARGPLPFANRADFPQHAVAPGADPMRLAAACRAELARRPAGSFAPRFGATSTDFTFYGDGFLNFVPECISLGHFTALVRLAEQRRFGTGGDTDPLSRRLLQRLLQEWLSVHAFLLKNGGAPVSDASDAVRALTTRLDEGESGFALLLSLLGSGSIGDLLDLRAPDYRGGLRFGACSDAAPCADPALRCETPSELAADCAAGGAACRARSCVLRAGRLRPTHTQSLGLAPGMLDGLRAMFSLAAETLAALPADGAPTPAALDRHGRLARLALVVETFAVKLRNGALDCRAGATECTTPAWLADYDRAREQLAAARVRAGEQVARLLPGGEARRALGLDMAAGVDGSSTDPARARPPRL